MNNYNKHNVQVNEIYIFTNNYLTFQKRVVKVTETSIFVSSFTDAGDELHTGARISWTKFNSYMDNFAPVQVL